MSPTLPRKSPAPAQHFGGHTPTTILRRRHVQSETGWARSTLYLRILEGLWPRPISLGARAVGWPASEVSAMNAARIAGLSDAQIRQLVVELVAARHRYQALTAGAPG